MASKDERTARQEFTDRYSIGWSDVFEGIEQRVIGAVWGANGFTTRSQADKLIDHLALRSDEMLLDIGSGRGWPGLYIAQQTGCRVVLSDLPEEGLKLAIKRAEREQIRLVGSISASARDLPFKPESFDAIVHTDVLC